MKIFTIIKEKSERIPNKNFTDVNGHPLWWHLLSELDGLDVTVNTDSEKFIKQLQNCKLKTIKVIKRRKKHVEWEKNKLLDSSPVEDMLFDFCETLNRSELVVLTHVTSPFLKKKTIFDAIDMLQTNKKSKSIHSVEFIQNFVWIKKDYDPSSVNFFTDRVQRTQDLPPILVSRGAFFIAKAGDILDQRKRLPDPVIYYPLGHIEKVDVDNFDDLEFTKLLKGKK